MARPKSRLRGRADIRLSWHGLRATRAPVRSLTQRQLHAAAAGIVGALAPHVPEKLNAKKAFQRDSLLMAERLLQEANKRRCESRVMPARHYNPFR